MCGIAGIIGKKDERLLQGMLAVQQHRGPNHTGIWCNEDVSLGHNRLSILDLSPYGNQPMLDNTGRYIIVFNGEIYNYIELKQTHVPDYPYTSHTDTEVLLAMYQKMGAGMLPYLIGMFSFAIWDKQERMLFAARDRFGVKPFYYAHQDGCIFFASELKTIWQAGIPKMPDDTVWAAFFAQGSYGLPHQTFWQHIQALPAGHCLHLPYNGEITINRWYHFENSILQQPSFLSVDELLEEYKALMFEAVKLRFRADVPVGFSISGGLDSSILLATVQQLHPGNNSMRAYSGYCNDDRYDELPWAEQLMERTGNPLQAVLLDVHDAAEAAEAMTLAQDEPYGGIPNIAYGSIFKAARQQNTFVMLDGQGMDEAWGGYDYYYKKNGGIVQGTHHSPVALQTLHPDFTARYTDNAYHTPFNNDLQNLQYRDLFYTKLPRALRFNDRASMMHSVELREPFIDHRLVEMAFAQPLQVKYRHGQTKWALRQMATQWLGNNLALAPKRAVQTPQREWLCGPLKDWAHQHIQWLATTGNPGWFNRNAMLTAWQQYQDGQGDNSFFIWQWINTAMLLRNKKTTGI